LNEVRIYSPTYAPVFRITIELEKSDVVPKNCQKWWNSRELPLPPYRFDLFEPVKAVDEDGLPVVSDS